MNVKLRKYKKEDLSGHLELFLMNNIYNEIDEKIKKQERDWLNKVIENYKKENPEFFVMAIILDEKLIGNLVIEKIDYKNRVADIGFWIGKKYWNKGVATEGLDIFLDRIAKKFKFKKIFANCGIKNIASGKVLEKAGFSFKYEKEGKRFYNKIFDI